MTTKNGFYKIISEGWNLFKKIIDSNIVSSQLFIGPVLKALSSFSTAGRNRAPEAKFIVC